MSPTNGFFGLPIGIKMFAVAGNCESGPEPAGASLQNNFIQMVLELLESDASEAVFELVLSPGPMPISRHFSFFFFFFFEQWVLRHRIILFLRLYSSSS